MYSRLVVECIHEEKEEKLELCTLLNKQHNEYR